MSDAPQKNKGGRPRVPEPGTRLSTYVRISDFDRLTRLAAKSGDTLSTVVRRVLLRRLADLEPGDKG